MDRKQFLIGKQSKEKITLFDVLRIEYPLAFYRMESDNTISFWSEDNEQSKPSKTKLNSLLKALQDDWDKYQYARDRMREYPAITEQLDMIYHNMDSWRSSILAIKSKYPKEG